MYLSSLMLKRLPGITIVVNRKWQFLCEGLSWFIFENLF